MFDALLKDFNKGLLPPKLLLSRFRLLDEQSRESRAYLDSRYLPFYYYLGKHFPKENLLVLGFGLGLETSLYLWDNKVTESTLAIQEPSLELYFEKYGLSNVKQVWKKDLCVYVGNFTDQLFQEKLNYKKWDIVLINQEKYDVCLLWLNSIWSKLNDGSLICVDHMDNEEVKKAYLDFCKFKEKESLIFPTRYGVGVCLK